MTTGEESTEEASWAVVDDVSLSHASMLSVPPCSTCVAGSALSDESLFSTGEEHDEVEIGEPDFSLAVLVGVCSPLLRPLLASHIPMPESPASDCARAIPSNVLYKITTMTTTMTTTITTTTSVAVVTVVRNFGT